LTKNLINKRNIMKKRQLLFLLILLLISYKGMAQQKYTISGYIRSSETGEALFGATVLVKELYKGTTANAYGFYSITLPEGKHSVQYSYMGNISKTEDIELAGNISNNVDLQQASIEIAEVVIVSEASNNNIKAPEMSVIKVSPKDVVSIPVIFGEQDILKTIQLMPGVNSAGEGNSGFYVRGGSADQNLIILDEAPIYSSAHLLGFFSVFNSDAVKDMEFYKGNAPANYGGRLSSVLDIQMKEGNSKKISASGGIGLIASRLTLEAPIVKDKGSFIISGRRTYADVFLPLWKDPAAKSTKLYFYDFNAKANFKINDKNRIFLSGYFGRDVFKMSDIVGFNWGNKTATLRWNHIFGNKLFLNSSLIYSDYNYGIGYNVGELLEITSGIKDYNLKEDFQYYINSKNTLTFGFNTVSHTFRPGKLNSENEDFFNSKILDKKHAVESAIYISHKFEISDRLILNYGLRYSNCAVIGPDTIYTYNKNDEITNSISYNKGDLIQNYGTLEPRMTLNYIINKKMSVKMSYARNAQYMHLLSNSSVAFPTDIWISSSTIVKPQIADQIALGFFRNFKDNMFETSVEVYYKNFQNQIDYQNGAEIILNKNVESQLVFGKGRAYGTELFIKKRTGDLTGWIGYTLSRTERSINEIDGGAWYPVKHDRTHDVSIVLMYDFSDKLKVSANWVYNTGNAVTFPGGKYVIDGVIVPAYTNRNGYRMPDYHRLDLGVTLTNKNRGKFESSWNFSVYNAYARKNTYSISFRESENDPSKTEAVRYSLFQIVPSVTYNFKF
jgi:hypothetical protein